MIFQFNRQLQADPNHPWEGILGQRGPGGRGILNKQVAPKVVTLCKIDGPYVSKNLKRESAIMAKRNHPTIVSFQMVVFVGNFY